MPSPLAAAETWMASQYDCSAGTSGAAGANSTLPARNISTTTGMSTNMPRNRSAGIRQSTMIQAATATKPITIENSYMLPHGTRCTANPRRKIDVRWIKAPSRVIPTAT